MGNLLPAGCRVPFVTGVLALGLMACGGRYQRMAQEAPQLAVTATDGHGYQLQLPQMPRRIVSLSPHTTEMLYAFGAGPQLVGVSETSDYPELPADLARVYTNPKLEAEALLALRPDLVIVGHELFPESMRQPLQARNVPVYFVRTTNLASVWSNIRAVGALTGHAEKARLLADSLQNLASKLAKENAGKVQYPSALFFGRQPMQTAGRGGYLHDMLMAAGAKNVFAHLKDSVVVIAPDSLPPHAPEFVLLPSDDSRYFADVVSQSPACNNLPAVLQNQVFQLNPAWYLRPGPRLGLGLMELTRALHPDTDIEKLISK